MTNKITTTLAKIRAHRPCGLKRGSGEGYDLLRKNLGKNYGDDTPITFSQIVESNGLNDALWCLRSVCSNHEKDIRLFAADCAERVLPLFESTFPKDKRPKEVIQAARDFSEGKITREELDAAGDAAGAAAWAARSAAWAAAGDAAWAAGAAAGDAAWAAGDAAGAAARAARAAAGDAAWDAARAARAAARSAAWAAERKIQTEMLTKRFS